MWKEGTREGQQDFKDREFWLGWKSMKITPLAIWLQSEGAELCFSGQGGKEIVDVVEVWLMGVS